MLNGTLDDFTLPDVLRLAASARRTGRLDVTRDCGAGRLWFRDGAVAAAEPAYGRRHASATPVARIEDLTFDLMRWDRGEFSWMPDPDGTADTSVDVEELLREVSRRLDELAEIKTLIPSEEAVPAMAPQPPEGAVQINITPAEWRVLVLVDGHRSVAEIAAAAGLDDLAAMKVLFGLAAAGLVRTGEAPAAPPPAPEPEAEPEPQPVAQVPPSEDVSDTTDMTDMTVVSDVSDTVPEDTFAAAPPDGDPFLAELDAPDEAAWSVELPPAPEEAPAVDRSTAARELAGLFDAADAPDGFGGPMVPAPPRPHRVEDDDQVTRGLISRLIDGVKGL